ncbi:helix-turn-helix transcriptional regulator [Enterobacter asburiae]|uniref:XRE family transcriptional regulator n=1 Tax=Enterobacter asburiae TaxID=61645 RepID=UPI002FFBC243
MKTFAERLQSAMKSAGMSQAELASRVGISQPAVWRLVAGQTNTSRRLVQIAQALGVTPEWLSTGEGAPSQEKGIVPRLSTSDSPSRRVDVFRVEVLDLSVSAGPGVYLSGFVEVLHAVEFTTEYARALFGNRREEDVKVMTVSGDSMTPTVNSGDRLFVDVSVRHFHMDGIYAFVFGETFHVKRLQMQGDKLAVLSDNAAYEKWYVNDVNQDQFCIMGKALIHESIKYNRL